MPRPPALPPPDVAPSAPTEPGEGGVAWRYEVAWAIAVTLLGFALRIGAASNSAVEHFDEGVYASNLFMGPDTDYRFPNQHLYAPPLHPAMIEWGMILFGLKTGPMLPGVILGGLTVPLLWWTVRGMFGGVAGLIAALILACDDFHIAHSASALTDVPVTFWILLSVGWLASGIEERDWWRTVLGGVACGVAWWTKYSGWLPLAIVGSAVVVSGVVERRGWRELGVRLGHWLVGVIVAVIVWSPWLSELQGKGGYQAVAANHRGYVVGWGGWWESLSTQVDGLKYWDGWPAIVAMGIALGLRISMTIPIHRFTGNGSVVIEPSSPPANTDSWRHDLRMAFPTLLAAVVAFLPLRYGELPLVTLGAVSGLVYWTVGWWIAGRRSRGQVSESLRLFSLLDWCLLAWGVGLLLSTPLYRPYPRLMLPALIPFIVWFSVASSGILVAVLRASTGRVDAPTVSRETRFRVGAVLAIVLVPSFMGPGLSDTNELRYGCRDLAKQIASRVGAEGPGTTRTLPDMPAGLSPLDTAIYVYGEPALVHHLRVLGFENAVPTSHLGFARPGVPASPVPTFVVIGTHARESTLFIKQWEEVHPVDRPSRIVHVADIRFSPSRMVALDSPPPVFEDSVSLYRVE